MWESLRNGPEEDAQDIQLRWLPIVRVHGGRLLNTLITLQGTFLTDVVLLQFLSNVGIMLWERNQTSDHRLNVGAPQGRRCEKPQLQTVASLQRVLLHVTSLATLQLHLVATEVLNHERLISGAAQPTYVDIHRQRADWEPLAWNLRHAEPFTCVPGVPASSEGHW